MKAGTFGKPSWPRSSLLVSPSGHLRPDPDPPVARPHRRGGRASGSPPPSRRRGAGAAAPGRRRGGDRRCRPCWATSATWAAPAGRRVCQLGEPEQRAGRRASPRSTRRRVGPLPAEPAAHARRRVRRRRPGARAGGRRLRAALAERVAAAGRRRVEAVPARPSPVWNLVGRVHFHLAENRRDPERPVRLPGHLHHRGRRRAARSSTPRWGRRCASTRARATGGAAGPAVAGGPRGRALRLGARRCSIRRALPAAGLDAGRGAGAPARLRGAGGGRAGGAGARALGPAAAAARRRAGDRRRQGRRAAWGPRRCWTSRWR